MDVVGVMAAYLPVVGVCTVQSRETLCSTLSRLCSTQTVPLYTVQYTHAPLYTVQYTHAPLYTVQYTHAPLYTVQYTHSASLHCAVHTQYLSTLCSTHTHHEQICCHNTDYVHVEGHDRTITVILAKHCIELPDDGSLVIRNMLEEF